MERLSLNSKPTNPDIEAAIHCARYAIAKNVVSGKKVLDVACGEGYGSYLLKNSGAHDVLGIDISDDVIKSCRKNYESEGIRFIAGSAEALPELLGDEKFDVIVCIETIEHVADVNMLLKGIKHVLKPDGVVIITCPNDHWYYAEAETQNIYHQRRYTFEEFQQISTNILGKDAYWSLGTACLGFVSTPTSAQRQYQQVPNTWFSHIDNCETYLVAENNRVEAYPESCGYFVGVWGSVQPLLGSAIFAITMDKYVNVIQAIETNSLYNVIRSNELMIDERDALLRDYESRIDSFRLAMQANELMIDERDALLRDYETRIDSLSLAVKANESMNSPACLRFWRFLYSKIFERR